MLDSPGSVPILVTGPSLFQDPKKKHLRFDLNFANVLEYPTIMDGLLRLSEAGRTPLTLTGDVHYPRLSRTTHDRGSGSRPWSPIYEVISSPASLVSGKHSGSVPTGPIPTYDIDTQAGATLACEKQWPNSKLPAMGNNVALLKFTWLPTGVKMVVRYYSIGAPKSAPDYFESPEVTLRHASEAQAPPVAELMQPRQPAPAPANECKEET
jgi:hypothetical protein